MDIASRPLAESPISLADEPDFMVGTLVAKPSVRQIVGGGESETLEPRVMQVLVALGRARGEVVSRDSLIASCWGGRAIGDDAINRAIGKLRRRAETDGSFRIDTIPRVGFRLMETRSAAGIDLAEHKAPVPVAPSQRNRRVFLTTAAAGIASAFAALTIWRRQTDGEMAPEIAPLMQQALIALNQNTAEGQSQAVGLYRRVVTIAPDYADGWGALGNAYAVGAGYRPTGERDAMRARAMSAGRRALALDPDNRLGQVALATAVPLNGNWLNVERALRRAASQHGDNQQLLFALGSVLISVGRHLEALDLIQRIERIAPPQPHIYYCHARLLWAANRIDEADRVMAEAASVYPTHFAIWFVRFYLLMYTGRASAAISLAQDRDSRPSGIPQGELDNVLRFAMAIQSGAPGAVSSVLADNRALAHRGAGYAENAIAFACAVNEIDEAFALAEAYYFGRGFVVPEVRFTREQGSYTPQQDRNTAFLFWPPTSSMCTDRRFEGLMTELGLTRYWREARVFPDYRAAAA